MSHRQLRLLFFGRRCYSTGGLFRSLCLSVCFVVYCGQTVQDVTIMCKEVKWECEFDISIRSIWHLNSGQTEERCEVTSEHSIVCCCFPSTNKTLTPYHVVRIFSRFALCLQANKFVRHIGGLSPTVCRLFLLL